MPIHRGLAGNRFAGCETRFNPRPPFRAGDTSGAPCARGSPGPVSIRARPFERAIPRPGCRCRRRACVSIRARPFERAIRGLAADSPRRRMFQSAPALSSGRYGRRPAVAGAGSGFNPRPPFRAGDTQKVEYHIRGVYVSIRARPFERAIRSATSCASTPFGCFNPRPPFRAGDTGPRPGPHWLFIRFNPRPPFRAGDTST